MLGIRYKQRDTQRRITIALALICLMVCSVDVQLYLERQVVAHTVTCPFGLNRQGNYFNMSISELMNVVVVDVQHSLQQSSLLNLPHCSIDNTQQSA